MTAPRESATLDTMFELIDGMNVPEGYRAEIIEGEIVLNPQRKAASTIIRLLTRSMEDTVGRDANTLQYTDVSTYAFGTAFTVPTSPVISVDTSRWPTD